MTLPSSADVRDELVGLRTRYGMSVARVGMSTTPALMSLRTTALAAARRNLHPDDAAVAVYEVIKCAVERWILREDWRTLLRASLNLGGRSEGVEDRRGFAGRYLGLSADTCWKREDEAFKQLAAVLVAGEVSPCDPDVDPDGAKMVRVLIDVAGDSSRIRRLLDAFVWEDREQLREALAAETINIMPGLRHPERGDTEAPLVALQRAFRVVNNRKFDPDAFAWQDLMQNDKWSAPERYKQVMMRVRFQGLPTWRPDPDRDYRSGRYDLAVRRWVSLMAYELHDLARDPDHWKWRLYDNDELSDTSEISEDFR